MSRSLNRRSLFKSLLGTAACIALAPKIAFGVLKHPAARSQGTFMRFTYRSISPGGLKIRAYTETFLPHIDHQGYQECIDAYEIPWDGNTLYYHASWTEGHSEPNTSTHLLLDPDKPTDVLNNWEVT